MSNLSEKDIITFIRCSQSTYDNLEPKDDNAVYFVLDTGRIYQGIHLVGEVNVGPEWEDPDAPNDPDDSNTSTAILGTARIGLMKLGQN